MIKNYKYYNIKATTSYDKLQNIFWRLYTTDTKFNKLNLIDLVKPLTSFHNCDTLKNNIFEYAKCRINQGTIYCLINQINSKCYVGSSVNLTSRLYKYYNFKYLYDSKSAINKSLLKYGYCYFSLYIL